MVSGLINLDIVNSKEAFDERESFDRSSTMNPCETF